MISESLNIDLEEMFYLLFFLIFIEIKFFGCGVEDKMILGMKGKSICYLDVLKYIKK